MGKLLWANLKMLFRGRQALFWALFFPVMFTVIFGFFFGNQNSNLGTIGFVNQSDSEIAQNLDKTLSESKILELKKEDNLDVAKAMLKKNEIGAIIQIPKDFGKNTPSSSKEIILISDPSNTQTNLGIQGFLQNFTTQLNFQLQNAKPIYSVKVESTADPRLNYFDFVLVGILGLALMNSSVQGIAITMAKYREDKILKRITTTPLKSWKFVIAQVLSRLVVNILQITIILLIGVYGFNAHVHNLGTIIPLALLGGVLFQSIGFAIASASKTTDAAQGLSVVATIPMMFLAGVFFPTDLLPKWLANIVQYLPLAPLLRMIRQAGLESASILTNPKNMIIVVAWIIVALTISMLRFRLSDE
ncbi:MAG: permease protein [Candidatus Berkelbacteria bacterium]|nr:permease protein [Candidatus Berkelbacteria bacterium]